MQTIRNFADCPLFKNFQHDHLTLFFLERIKRSHDIRVLIAILLSFLLNLIIAHEP